MIGTGNIICKSQYVYGNRSNGMINNGIQSVSASIRVETTKCTDGVCSSTWTCAISHLRKHCTRVRKHKFTRKECQRGRIFVCN